MTYQSPDERAHLLVPALSACRLTRLADDLTLIKEHVPDMVRELVFHLHFSQTKDDVFLAVALGGTAEYLVTGDNDLLSLKGVPELGDLL